MVFYSGWACKDVGYCVRGGQVASNNDGNSSSSEDEEDDTAMEEDEQEDEVVKRGRKVYKFKEKT